jgi:hypothetical protein
VVDAVIKAQFLYHIAAFVSSARDTHCSGTLDSRDLAPRVQQHLAWFGLGNRKFFRAKII